MDLICQILSSIERIGGLGLIKLLIPFTKELTGLEMEVYWTDWGLNLAVLNWGLTGEVWKGQETQVVHFLGII